eukprot:TCALIF_07534-PA protein Name:"Similar to Ints2 Integrator complex subunit 2 (Mus musculus)" AED:0.04 eAED:0.04 QI:98/0.83/0.85/1/1/1/7/109/1177
MWSERWPPVSPRVFSAIRSVDVGLLSRVPDDAELRPVLATLVRLSLISSLDASHSCSADRTAILGILSRIELVNNLVALLSIDFHALETDVRKELAFRASPAGAPGAVGASDSPFVPSLALGPALEFERSDATRRLRLVLAEIITVMGQLFDHLVYFSEVCDVLCIAMAELPNLLLPCEVAEALLRFKFGSSIICHVVANQPDSFSDVVFHLLKNGDKQDEAQGNKVRQDAILCLCQMNPSEIISVRNKCIEWCRMPSLLLLLTLHQQTQRHGPDMVSCMSGLLLGSDPQIRSWISFFVRNGQKQNPALKAYRAALLGHLRELTVILRAPDSKAVHQNIVRASALLRLYTALRGIAGMKFSEEEIHHLLELITSQPPPTPAGIKFVSLGLCMIIACNSLLSAPELEKKAVEWLKWLVQEETYFEQKAAVSASFGEMLLLMAIHFHSQQLSAICDLVCQTLGMKFAIRTTGMNKMKTIFTQDIFTEHVVASHAVKVPVTMHLSADCAGFLPIHCVHQLLKSRTFSKNRVSIKEWIYNQICASSTPLHPVLPSLIEVYVNSILVPATNRGVLDQTNEPISEKEIRAVFKHPVFAVPTLSTPLKAKGRSRDVTPFRSRSTPRSSRAGSPLNASKMDLNGERHFSASAQIVMLYYILLYEQVRLTHMKQILASQRKVLRYSHELLAELPIKFLVQVADQNQEDFGGIFPQLLRLCSTQFPHLCLVQDWLEDDRVLKTSSFSASSSFASTNSRSGPALPDVKEAFSCIQSCPSKLILVMRQLLQLPCSDVWKFSDVVIGSIREMLKPDTPRQIKDLYKNVWFEMNRVFPRKLWSITCNAVVHEDTGNFCGKKRISYDDIIIDPLQVLRCDRRVFRCGPILEIMIYILKACLAASKTHLTQHILDNPIMERTPNAQISNDMEREELKNALVSTQESAVIQILLESVVPQRDDEEDKMVLSDLREVQSLVCSYIHEAFITDPTLAKLVHFQGYPQRALALTVPGVPSMHICLDFVPELLSQPDVDKQIFGVDLISHLSIQYALPRSYSIARLAVNALSTLLSVLSQEERNELFPSVLDALPRFCKAFPPLIEDVVSLLLQYGKIVVSQSSLQGYSSPKNFDLKLDVFDEKSAPSKDGKFSVGEEMLKEFQAMSKSLPSDSPLTSQVQMTFKKILQTSLLENNLF